MNMNLLQEKTDSNVKATAGVWSWSINLLQDIADTLKVLTVVWTLKYNVDLGQEDWEC
jgi:hypothetical protein